VRVLQKLGILAVALCCVCLAGGTASGATVAVFPLQELDEGRNDANLPFTRVLAERLTKVGNEVIAPEAVIAFMANHRIRTVGHLETTNISRARRELGAAFVLLGTVSQRKERPEPRMGLTLSLVRTSDARTVWTYVGSVSMGEERRVLGIGEPRSTAALEPMLLNEIIGQWPWGSIKEEQQASSLNIDVAALEPRYVRPGKEVQCRVRLRDVWTGSEVPRVFFRAGDQLYPATGEDDGRVWRATWVAGEENGRVPVTLLLEWPEYGRIETAMLGSYLIDGTPPLVELELGGTRIVDGIPVFNNRLVMFPRLLVRKPLSRWRLAIYAESDNMIGDSEGIGNLPESLIWSGARNVGDGIYVVEVEIWDNAGNSAKASQRVAMDRSVPKVDLVLNRSDEEVVVDLLYDGKVPLKYWRLEMWTKEGRIVTQAEGEDLPVRLGVDLPDSERDPEIEGRLVYQDAMGKQVRRKIGNLLAKVEDKAETKAKEEPKGVSESWVDGF